MVAEINPINNTVSFTNGEVIEVGKVRGDASEKGLRTIQIRETIRAHLEKERQLYGEGIKVLSLFFIDEVAKYRQYDEQKNPIDGEYVTIFKEQYRQVVDELMESASDGDGYWDYLRNIDVDKTHNGYFSIDKSKRLVDPKLSGKKSEESAETDDVSAYDLILKDKERLLSFQEPTRFIFSHSALREGWDNPNVFTICMLKHSNNVISRRQEVGRGLRLAVNHHGTRMDGNLWGKDSKMIHQINNLMVITNESYKTFVENLQQELLETVSTRPSQASVDYFCGKIIKLNEKDKHIISKSEAKQIHKYLQENHYIDENDHIADVYRQAKSSGDIKPLPEDLRNYQKPIERLINEVFSRTAGLRVEDARNIIPNPINQKNYSRKEFGDLWNKISRKAAFEIRLDSEKLAEDSVNKMAQVARERGYFVKSLSYELGMSTQKDEIALEDWDHGTGFDEYETQTEKGHISASSQVGHDLIGSIVAETDLTRKTVVNILKKMDPAIFAQYSLNPELFIREVIQIVNEQKIHMLIQDLTYIPLQQAYEKDEVFDGNQTLKSAYRAQNHVLEYVPSDSKIETNFAKALDNAKEVMVYAKLPDKFYIPTPFGNYTPDWAIVFQQEMVRQVYFIAETKGSADEAAWRENEYNKIESAKRFFEALDREDSGKRVKYGVISKIHELMELVKEGALSSGSL